MSVSRSKLYQRTLLLFSLLILGLAIWGHARLRQWQQFAQEGRIIFNAAPPSATEWPVSQATLHEFPNNDFPFGMANDGMKYLCTVQLRDGKSSSFWFHPDSYQATPGDIAITFEPDSVHFSIGRERAKYLWSGGEWK